MYYRRLKSLLKPNKENLERNIYPQIILVSIRIEIYYAKKTYVVKELYDKRCNCTNYCILPYCLVHCDPLSNQESLGHSGKRYGCHSHQFGPHTTGFVSGVNKLGTYKHYNCSSVLLHYISEELLWGELVHHAAADQNPLPLQLYCYVTSSVSMSYVNFRTLQSQTGNFSYNKTDKLLDKREWNNNTKYSLVCWHRHHA